MPYNFWESHSSSSNLSLQTHAYIVHTIILYESQLLSLIKYCDHVMLIYATISLVPKKLFHIAMYYILSPSTPSFCIGSLYIPLLNTIKVYSFTYLRM